MRFVLRFDTFAVLVTVVGTFSVSKLFAMDVICVDGEGPRVQSVCGVQIIEIFLNLQKNSERAQCVSQIRRTAHKIS